MGERLGEGVPLNLYKKTLNRLMNEATTNPTPFILFPPRSLRLEITSKTISLDVSEGGLR